MLDVVDKDFKVIIINMFKELREAKVNEFKEGMMIVPPQI